MVTWFYLFKDRGKDRIKFFKGIDLVQLELLNNQSVSSQNSCDYFESLVKRVTLSFNSLKR